MPDSSPGSPSRRSASADASLHTASCFQRSDRTTGRRSGEEKTHIAAARASAPAPFAVSVRFQFVVIVCLLRFPAVVPVASSAWGSVPGPASPNRLRGSSIEFKSVKIMFSLSVRSGAAERRSRVPSGFFPSPPALARLAPSSSSVRTTGFPPSVFPAYHPVPVSCSVRLLFVWFMVCISFRFVFRSVCLSRSLRLALSVSACFGSFFRLVFPFRFELVFTRLPAHRRYILYILAYIIHD